MNQIKKSEKYFKNSKKLKIIRKNQKTIENSKSYILKNYGKIMGKYKILFVISSKNFSKINKLWENKLKFTKLKNCRKSQNRRKNQLK